MQNNSIIIRSESESILHSQEQNSLCLARSIAIFKYTAMTIYWFVRRNWKFTRINPGN